MNTHAKRNEITYMDRGICSSKKIFIEIFFDKNVASWSFRSVFGAFLNDALVTNTRNYEKYPVLDGKAAAVASSAGEKKRSLGNSGYYWKNKRV